MRKFVFLAVAVGFAFFVARSEAATSPTPPQKIEKTKPISRCLKTTYCQQGGCVVSNGHRVQLATDPTKAPLRSNYKTYINECFSYTPAGANRMINVCTTGNSQLDLELHGKDNYTQLKNDLGYQLEAIAYVKGGAAEPIYPPAATSVQTDGNANIPVVEWQDYTPQGHERRWLAFQIVTETKALRVKEGGEQQAELDFLEDPQVCAPLGWDPDGRVFDAVTLDPVPNTSVKLQKKNEAGAWVDPNVPPNFKVPTAGDGKYGYDVTDGEYKLVVLPPSSYTFPVTSANALHPNYSKIYLDPFSGGTKTAIYPSETGEVITVAGTPKHADIPLKPNSAKGYSNKNVRAEFIEQRLLSGDVVLQGEASHPFTKILIYSGNQVVKTLNAKRDGTFNITLDRASLPAGARYSSAGFQAINLTGQLPVAQNFLKRVLARLQGRQPFAAYAQEEGPVTTYVLNQIPGYLDGFAYDGSGNPMLNTKVEIYLSYSNIPSYETTTDERGYFKITSEFLPSTPYDIQYTSATGTKVKITPDQFMDQNAKYLADNQIDLFTYRNAKGTNELPPFFAQKLSPTQGQTPVVPTTQPSGIFSNNSTILLIVVILIALLGVVGVVLTLQLLKKNQEKQPPTPA